MNMQSDLDPSVLRALRMWSRLIQAASTIVIGLSLVLMLTPSLGESLFYLVYFQQPNSPVTVPEEVEGYLRFANGIIGAVMAGWMLTIILLARGPFMTRERYAWRLGQRAAQYRNRSDVWHTLDLLSTPLYELRAGGAKQQITASATETQRSKSANDLGGPYITRRFGCSNAIGPGLRNGATTSSPWARTH